MNNWQDKVTQIGHDLKDIKQIQVNDIPNIDLYMDQVLTFLNSNLEFYKRNELDTILTKTMINNYSKEKLLPQTNNKRYRKLHMMGLILVYQLKRILSISDLKIMTKPMKHTEDLQVIYELYLKEQLKEFSNADILAANIIKNTEKAGVNNTDEALPALVAQLMASAQLQIMMAERIIDTLSKDIEQPESKEKPTKE